MTLEKTIATIKERQPEVNSELLEKTYLFLKKETADFGFSDRKRIYNIAIEAADKAAENNACLEFICATLLFELVKKKKGLEKAINKELGEKIELIIRSYDFIATRLEATREDLVKHSCRTASALASLKIGTTAICAALLHEAPIYGNTPLEEIEKKFNQEIRTLVEKFISIRVIKTTNNGKYISHLREMTVAMVQDLRVIIIKMCSNIDRMKNLDPLTYADKLKNIAAESLEILAPLADLLGIWDLRWQLEDLSFQILQPEEYDKIHQRFNIDERRNRDKYIQKTKQIVQKATKEANIECHIEGRFKHYYSIYQKMKYKKKSFNEICDVFALRIVVNTLDECYRILGIVHRLWKPKQNRIKDYIAAPKDNNYRSLHTTVFGLNGRATEFQIRTREMEEVANFGIAAHWYYKNPRKKTPDWIQDLLIKQQQYNDDAEFLEKFSSNILQNRIYVYTPKGDVVSLPVGATPVDFAYQIHTEIGNKCSGAIVNDITVPLSFPLSTNDVVEIIINRQQKSPDASWLNFTKTNTAKKHIEDYLNKETIERHFRL